MFGIYFVQFWLKIVGWSASQPIWRLPKCDDIDQNRSPKFQGHRPERASEYQKVLAECFIWVYCVCIHYK